MSVISLRLLLAFGGHLMPAPHGGHVFVPRLDGAFWTMTRLTLAARVVILVGLALPLVAWTGALVNTYQLQEKMWYAALLAGGLLGLLHGPIGFVVMLAYRIAGPDVTSAHRHDSAPIALPPSAELQAGHRRALSERNAEPAADSPYRICFQPFRPQPVGPSKGVTHGTRNVVVC